MPKRVGVSGGSPAWRRGLAAILGDAGYSAVEVPSLVDWRPGRDGVAVILDMTSDQSYADLAEFKGDHPVVPVVAVVMELSLSSYAAVVRAGAGAAIGNDDEPEAFVAVLGEVLDGRSSIPVGLARSLAARIPAAPDPEAWVGPDDVTWLRGIAEGKTVAGLADEVGYSEREMFRLLRDLYLRIGVRSRTEAIVWATRHGVLDDS